LNHEGREGSRRKSGQGGSLLSLMRAVGKLVVLQLLRGYKWGISPMFPPACRFVPTCSEYAMEAVERYGAVRGGLIALWRLLRCHPFAHGGYDPVPQGLKPDISVGLDGAAGSGALSRQDQTRQDQTRQGQIRQDQKPHFSQRTREMGHPAAQGQ
jgi:putative membrane protein insertion efficiency factor